MTLRYHPLTPDRWADLEALFGARGACAGCWCMWWRLPRAQWEKQKGETNRAAFRRIVEAAEPPGILAYDGQTPIGWCAVAPRETYAVLERSRALRRLDALPVWSVTCLFVAPGYRKKGVSVGLLEQAAEYAASRGAAVVEGYPVQPKKGEMPPAFAWTGLTRAFERAGFQQAGRGPTGRPIWRRTFSAPASA